MQTHFQLMSYETFFEQKDNLNKFVQVITKTSHISLRLLDYFCVNYAKKHNTIYRLSNGKMFNVYLNYKTQLKLKTKKCFDPFRRKDRYVLHEKYITTIGQMFFFEWCIENEILEYVENNILLITNDMKHSTIVPRVKKSKIQKNDKKIAVLYSKKDGFVLKF